MSDLFDRLDGLRHVAFDAAVELDRLQRELAEARGLLASAVDVVAACHDCIRFEAPGLHAKIDAFLAATAPPAPRPES